MTFKMPNNYYDPPEPDPFYPLGNDTKQRARIQHKCYHCTDPIEVGEEYWRGVVIDEDRKLIVWKQHVNCPWIQRMVDKGEW